MRCMSTTSFLAVSVFTLKILLISSENNKYANGSTNRTSSFHDEDKNNTTNCLSSNEQIHSNYGVDVSWPIHHHHHQVSTNYPLGNKRILYEKYMTGCIEYYKPDKNTCQTTEEYRINANLNQVSSHTNYTNIGYKKTRVPDILWTLIKEFYEKNKDNQSLETFAHGYSFLNHWEVPVHFIPIWDSSNVGGGIFLKRLIAREVRDIVQEWTNTKLATTSVFGVRIYKEGAILSPHVDRPSLITSAIINIDQDVDEPWPLEVYGRNGLAVNITMEPGEMVLYESHTLIHGRPFPFKGKYFANIFVHFEPYSEGQAETVIEPGTTDAHIASREGNLDGLKSLLKHSPNNKDDKNMIFFQRDDNGWMPIHEAARNSHVHIVQFLLQNGVNVNEYTSILEDGKGFVGGTPLHWALTEVGADHPIVMFLKQNWGLDIEPLAIEDL